jgi:hypothetical protein
LFDSENISFDASLLICVNSTNIPPIMIINRIYEHQILLSLQLVSFLVRLRTYQHPCTIHNTPLREIELLTFIIKSIGKIYFIISTQNWIFSVIKELPILGNFRRQGFETVVGAPHQYESRIISSPRHAGLLHGGEITADKHSYLLTYSMEQSPS